MIIDAIANSEPDNEVIITLFGNMIDKHVEIKII